MALSLEHDWEVRINNDMGTISSMNDSIVSKMKERLTVQAKLNAAAPLTEKLAALKSSIAALHASFSAITTKLDDVKTIIDLHQIRVDQTYKSLELM
jgi:uncharacterized coiled-coil protein SlyX